MHLPLLAVLFFCLLGSSAMRAEPPVTLEELLKANPNVSEALDGLPAERLSKPYRYRSLKGLSNEQLLQWFLPGKTIPDLRQEVAPYVRFPKDFWTAPPDEAAKALLEANMSEEQRKAFPVRVPKAAAALSPAGSVEFFADPYWFGDAMTVLRWHPEMSWFATSSESKIYWGLNLIYRRNFEMRWLPVAPKDARHMAEVVMALRRCTPGRAEDLAFPWVEGAWTDVARCTLATYVDGRKDFFEQGFDSWPRWVRGEWTGEMSGEALGNIARVVVIEGFIARLGKAWKELYTGWLDEDSGRVTMSAKARESSRKAVAGILKCELEQPGLVPPTLLAHAVAMAGDYGFVELAGKLEALEKVVPGTGETEERLEKLNRGIARAVRELGEDAGLSGYQARGIAKKFEVELAKGIPGTPPGENETPAPPSQLPPGDSKFDKVDKLHVEMEVLETSRGARSRALPELRAALTLARKQFARRSDPAALEAWVWTGEPDWWWALTELRKTNRPAVEKLVGAIFGRERKKDLDEQRKLGGVELNGGAADGLLQVLSETSPKQALELAAGVPEAERTSEMKKRLDVSQPMEEMNYAELLRIAQNKSDTRWQALGELSRKVAKNKSLDAESEAALRQTLVAAGDELSDVTDAAAAALATSHAVKHWDLLENAAEHSVTFGALDTLGPLAAAAGKNRQDFAPKFQTWLARQFETPKIYSDPLAWTVWAADLRELKPRLEALATSSSEDYGAGQNPPDPPMNPRRREHLARQLVSIWNEEDLATRAKLVATLGFTKRQIAETAIREPALAEYAKAIAGLDAAGRTSVAEYLKWLENAAEVASSEAGTAGPWLFALRQTMGEAKK